MTAVESGAPLISVVMSCYNAERWLAESIESVLSQTWRNFEFIIVDDGSTDETGRIIAGFAAQDARIVPISKPNTGLADSLNIGIARARGTWIARLDADDLCEPERLASQWRAVSANAALVFVGTGLVLIDEHGKRSAVHHYPSSHRKLVAHLATARKFPAHSSAFFSADAFRRVGGYRPRIRRAQDRDLWLRLSEVGELTSLGQPLVQIRKHTSQISHEEGGMRQLIDSHIAMVSYWLRRAGQIDPVAAGAGEFETFSAWIGEHVVEENLLGFETLRRSIKPSLSGSTPSFAVSVMRQVMTNPALIWQIGLEHLRGSQLPRRWAADWIDSRKAI